MSNWKPDPENPGRVVMTHKDGSVTSRVSGSQERNHSGIDPETGKLSYASKDANGDNNGGSCQFLKTVVNTTLDVILGSEKKED